VEIGIVDLIFVFGFVGEGEEGGESVVFAEGVGFWD
jgi:hypothetical protein